MIRSVLSLGCALSVLISGNAFAGTVGSLRYLAATTVANDFPVGSTKVGGLSGIDCKEDTGECIVVSDKPPTRFYKAQITLSQEGDQNALAVSLTDPVELLDKNNRPYPTTGEGVPDPESIRFAPSGNGVWWSSEGWLGDDGNSGSTFVQQNSLDGSYIGDLKFPDLLAFHKGQDIGARENLGFEGLSISPDKDALWLGMESAVFGDGKVASMEKGTRARFTKFKIEGPSTSFAAQYLYPVDPIPAVSGQIKKADNGVSEILALDDHRLLVLERSFVLSKVAQNFIRIYEVDVSGAQTIKDDAPAAGAEAMKKRLVLDLTTVKQLQAEKYKLDNIEGMTFGPRLLNGHRSLVLVSDNNFNDRQITEFLAFEVVP